jgi:hypothetical protein
MRRAEAAIKNQNYYAFSEIISELGEAVKNPNEEGLTLLHLIADSTTFTSSDMLKSLIGVAKKNRIFPKTILNSLDPQGRSAFTRCMQSSGNIDWRMQFMLLLLMQGADPHVGVISDPLLSFSPAELKYISSSPNYNNLYQEIERKASETEEEKSDLVWGSLMSPRGSLANGKLKSTSDEKHLTLNGSK